MKTAVFLNLVGFFLQDTTAVTHSVTLFLSSSSGVPDFPEFVALSLVDDLQINYYDSNTKRLEPKQDWMNKVTEDEPGYWESQTNVLKDIQQTLEGNIGNLKERFNQTGGVHIYQVMYGCEWNDETGEVKGYRQIGYDGEDRLVFDMKTFTYVAAQQNAVACKESWNNDKVFLAQRRHYLTKECPYYLKKFVEFGKSSLMRKDLPTVSLLQKTPSSRITCHATGFYPSQAAMFWRKDGEELHDNVEHGETLPNHDGSFQMSADLELPSDDWGKYECVFQLSGVRTDLVTKLDKKDIKTNYVDRVPMIIGIIVVVFFLALAIIGFLIYKRKNSMCETSSETNSEPSKKTDSSPLMINTPPCSL